MAEDKISSTISIDVADAKANLADLAREVRLAESAFQAATGGMGNWADTLEGNQAKATELTTVIAAQEEMLRNLSAQYEAAVAAKGEDSAAAENLQIKMNNLQAKIQANKSELEGVNEKLSEFSGNADTAGDSAEGLGDDAEEANGKLSSLGAYLAGGLVTAAAASVAALVSVGKACIDLGKQALDMTNSAGKRADELLTQSQQTGIDTTTLQRWTYASQFIDTEVSTITGSITQMERKLGTIPGAFEDAGIEIYDAAGNYRDSTDIFWDIIAALGEMDNATERDMLAMQLFGRSAKELNPLILAGRDAFEGYGDEAENIGYVMSEEVVALMGAYDDSQNKLTSSITALQQSISAVLAPIFQTFTDMFSGVFGDIAVILGDGLQEGDLDAIASRITDALNEVLNIVVQNAPELIGTFTEIINSLISGLTEGDALSSLLTTLVSGLVDIITNLASHAGEITSALVTALASIDWLELTGAIISGIAGVIGSLGEALFGIMSSIAGALWDALQSILPDWLLELFSGEEEVKISAAFEGTAAAEAINELADKGVDVSLEDFYQAQMNEYLNRVLEAYGVTMEQLSEETQGDISELIADFLADPDGAGNIADVLGMIGAAIENDEGYGDAFAGIGYNMAGGVAEGIAENAGAISAALAAACNMAIEDVQGLLDIHSPSRVTRDLIGRNFGMGIAEGITDTVGVISTSARAATGAAVASVNSSTSSSFAVTNNVQATIRSEADIELLAARLAARNKRIARGYGIIA